MLGSMQKADGKTGTCIAQFNGSLPSRLEVRFDAFPEAGMVMADRITVTGGENYGLTQVLKNLGLPNKKDLAKLSGQRIVSLGEGMSPLVPNLRQAGARAFGVDLWYGSKAIPDTPFGRKMKAHFQNHKKVLIQASADKLPFKDRSVDMILSHALFNNIIERPFKEAIIREALRVLWVGGELRILGITQATLMADHLQEKYGHKVDFGFEGKVSETKFGDSVAHHSWFLLKVQKLERIFNKDVEYHPQDQNLWSR
jgi:hypothetical protein